MEIRILFYSVLSKLIRKFSPSNIFSVFAIVLLSFAQTELRAQHLTQTTIVAANNPSCSDVGVDLTATVADLIIPANTPTGTVQFIVDGSSVGGPIALSGGIATFTTAPLPGPTHAITANYISDDPPTFNNSVSNTITQTVTTAPSATINYAGSPFCSGSGTATVTLTGTTGGTFTSTVGLVINAATGDIDLAASTAGPYTVTYTIAAAGGCGPFTTTANIIITAPPSATINYAGSPFCSGPGTATVTLTGTGGGSYSSTVGLVINAATGDIDLAASTAGPYVVTYTIAAAGGCGPFTTTANINITAPPSATINYAGSPFCSGPGTATVTLTGTTGGSYSSTVGLVINAATGDIDLAASTAGPYVVTYTIAAAGGCPVFTTTAAPITINAPPSATINYAGSPFCSGPGTATVTLTGTTGGSYSSTVGLVINAATGDIDLAASTAGPYTVTYTIAAAGGCPVFTTTAAPITINAPPSATISYAGSPFCSGPGTATVTLTGTAGGSYSSTAGLAIDAVTGDIDLAASTAGPYTVTYTIAASGGCGPFSTTANISITAPPSATINYAGSPFCSGAGTATVTLTGTAGGSYSSTVGLVINAATGDIDLAASTAGTYPVTYSIAASGGCGPFTTTTSINITAPPSATINYAGSPFCSGAGTATVTLTGTTGGSYSSTAGLVINAVTGDIDLAASTAGPYVITYTIAASGGCGPFSTTTNISIAAPPSATINYTGSPFCSGPGTATVTLTGTGGGTFTSTVGLVINAATGDIDLAASTAGPYVITYTIAASGGCGPFTTTTNINITAPPSATINYAGSPFCSGPGTATVTQTGTAGGSYSSTVGLVINAVTGDIDLAASAAGTYTVTYTIAASGGCGPFTTTANINITAPPSATINYAGSPFCSGAGTATVTLTGTGGGSYSSTAGLAIDAVTGDIDLAASTAGPYVITYTIAASGGCGPFTTTTSITITAPPSATINYAGSPFCSGAGTATVTLTGTAGGSYSSTVGLVINAVTGDIDLAASTAGPYVITYTIAASGGCGPFSTTTNISIAAPPSATINYTGSPFCSGAGTAAVTLTGTAGGSYSSTVGLVINAVTGDIDLAASTAGPYVITYTVAASGGCGPFTTTTNINITAPPSATINYAGSPFCSGAGTATVTLTGTTGGSYSSTAGLAIDAVTGDIDLAASTAGTYVITYTVAASGGCGPFSTTANISIAAPPSATINYAGSPFCSGAGTATVTLTGTGGGSYSSTAGLAIDAVTGDIDLAASTAGPYTVTYTIAASGGCGPFTTTASINITAPPSATINYAGSPFCSGAGTAAVTLTGTAGGSYSSTVGLVINAVTGDIDLAASTAGPYVITYTVAASGGCGPFTTTTNISIAAPPSATINYTGSPFCSGAGTAAVTLTGTAGGSYSSTVGLVINAVTGDIDLAASTAGTYTVTYSIAASGGCPVFTTTAAPITINAPVITVAVTTTDESCGLSNGSITFGAVTGGVAPFTYSVNGSLFTATTVYNNLAAGTYTIAVTDANGCLFNAPNAVIGNTAGPTALVVNTTDASCGLSNGSITLGAVTGGVAPYTYSVNGSLFTATTVYNNLAAAAYSIAVTDANGCLFNAPNAVIGNTAGPTAIAVTILDATCGNNNGSITFGAVTGGVAPFTYSVNGSLFTATTVYNNLAAATYTIAVTDANGCLFNAPDAVIGNTAGPTAIAVTILDATCGNNNGSITFGAVTGGVAPFTYSVNGSLFTATTVYNNLAAATYTIAVTDANGCLFNAPDAVIGNTAGPTAIAVTILDATCGNNNGSITLGAVTGGVAPFTYSVNGSLFTATTVYNNLAAGTYTIAVTDANGCLFNAPDAIIANTAGPSAIVVNTTDASCALSNGTLTLGTVTGGVAPYTYSVNGSAFTATTVYNNLAAATYSITVTDANGCLFNAPDAVIGNTASPTAIAVTTTNASCGNNNGSINLGAVTGGAAPYTYSVNGSLFTATTVYNNLAAATYTIAVTDANGCLFNAPDAVIGNTAGPTAIAVTILDATCGNNNGSITLGAVNGGVAPYTYSVNGSAFTATTIYNNLAAATYAITVTDANGCLFNAPDAVIGNTAGPTAIAVTSLDASCGLNNGSITLGAVTGGVAPYTYSVNGSAFTATTIYNNLAAATYSIAVTDANGCLFNAPDAVINNTGGATAIAVTTTAASCGNSNGSITLGAVTGGVAPYTYSVNGSAFTATTLYTNLAAATYTIAVTDANGCLFNAPDAVINNIGGATAIAVTTTGASCGLSNGTLTLGTVTGGVAPFTYSVNGSLFTATTVYNNLAAATYTIAVTDANGCLFNAPDAIIANTAGPSAIVVNTTDASCGLSNGTLTLGTVTGGVAPYTYSVNGSAFTATTVYNNLAAATYTIAVTDANGCLFNAPDAVINNTGGATAIAVTTTDASCGLSNGTLTLGAVTGGVAPYTYSVNGSAFTATTVYNNLAAATYSIAVTDANGCLFNAPDAVIGNTAGPTAIAVTILNASCGNNNGSITLGAVTGGVAPYTYSVNGSAFTATTVYNNLAAATYTIAVTDANGCLFNAPDAVIGNTSGPTAIAVTILNASCGNNNGSITLGAVTGGVAPYTYSVNGSAFTATTVYNTLAAATYTIAVTDANGCLFNAPDVVVGNTAGPAAIAVTILDASCGLNNGSITLGAVTGGVAPYTYSVNGSAFTATTVYNNLAAATYSIAVTDANGCLFNAPDAVINNTGGATAIAVTTTDASCGLSNGTLTLGTVTGGVAPYTYSVNGSAFTATTVYNNLAAATYSIAVTDANGCLFNAPDAVINNTGGATAIAVTTTAASCGNSNGSITLGAVTGGVAPYTYSVNGSAFTATTLYSNLAAATYSIAVTDANGCLFNAPDAVINNTGGATAIAVTTTDASCGLSNGTLTLGTVTGGVAPYTYSVNGSAFTTTTIYNNLAAATYTIAVTDANGCLFNAPDAVIGNTAGPTAIAVTILNASCGNNNGSITLGAVTGGVAPYTYSVNGSAFTATTVYNTLAAATYSIAVTDANGCLFNAPDAVIGNTSGPTAIAVTSLDASCGNNNGSITLGAVTGGVAPYTYSVNGSAFTATTVYNNLAAATYTIAVTDANGCLFNAPDAVINNTGGATAIVVTTTAASCGLSNGTLTLGTVTGGVAPYTYSVNGSAFTATTVYNNLAAATYSIAVTDANGCLFNAPDAVINNIGGATAIAVTTTDASCGLSNGTLTLGTVTGGVAPYTYSVNGSAFTATTLYSNLVAATYSIAVTDANGCLFNAPDAVINNIGGATAIAVTKIDASCGLSNGTLTLGTVTGGVAPYTYSVNGSAFTATTVYNNLAAATYTIAVTDANGCLFNAPDAVINNTGGATAIAVTATDASCGSSNGSITLGAVTGGVAPYAYSVNGSAFTATTVYNNLAAATYTIAVTDANGCLFNAPDAVINNTGGATAIAVTVTNASCGNNNGSITLGAVTGGVAPYTYSVNGSAFTATTVYNNLAAATYSIAVTDANGCLFNAPDAVINNISGATAIAVTKIDASCGNNNGSITLGAVTGGVAPYTYSVNGSAFTATTVYNNLAAATYSIAVTDANGCHFNAPDAVINSGAGPTAIVVNTTNAGCGLSNGSITLGAVTGGVAPYTYSVNGSAFTATTVYNTLAAGTYTIAVKDANGCLFNAPDALINNTGGATAIAVTTTAASCGNSNGSITLGAVTGGVAPYTYSVNGSAFTATTLYSNLVAATYTIAVTDANGCLFNAPDAVINNTDGATAIAVTTTDASCGLSNGTLTLGTVTGGVAPYTYSVNGSAFTATTVYNNLAAATYSIAVTDANGCLFNAPDAVINNTGGATAIAVTTTNASCGNNNGSITLGAVTGGVAPYTYSVNGSAFTAMTVYNNLAAATYSIAVTDANGCLFNAPDAVINNGAGPTAIVVNTTNAGCGLSNGSITLGAVTGGVPPYTYSVNGSAFTATTLYSNLAAATYTIAVTDANGCLFNAQDAVINNTGGATAIVVTTTDANCGLSNGRLTLGTVTGGVAPYTYSVNGSAFTATTLYTNLAAGTYTIAVTDAIGCLFNAPDAVINITSGATAIAVTAKDASCGLSNGSITLGTVTGGVAPYMYSFNGSSFTATTVYNNLAAGIYSIAVKDANGCLFNAPDAVINSGTGPIAIAATTTDAGCGLSNGTITLSAVTGGVAPYTYSVNGSAFTATTVYNNLAAGTYTIAVTDANGCLFNAPDAVINNTGGATAIAVTATDASCGLSNGSITLGAVTAGVAPYTYSVNGSTFTATTVYNNLAAATYSIAVKDANGCLFNAPDAVINNGTGPTAIVINTTDASCGLSNGSITLGAVTGGVAPYTYSVNGGAFTATTLYSNLTAGTYTIAVADASGCVFNAQSALINSTGGTTAIVVTKTDAGCGMSNGSITLGAVTGGVAPYTYSVNGSAFTATTVYKNLAAGSYTIAVSDANGCVFNAPDAVINNTGGPTAIAVTTINAGCGLNNGILTLGAVTGGVAPYTYSVNGGGFTATTLYTNLAAGTYTIAVADANGCVFNAPDAVINNMGGATAIAVTTTGAGCGLSNGTLTLGAVTGGVAPYTYSVNGSAFTSTTLYNNLAAGNYTIAVKDANGCVFNAPDAVINNAGGATAIAVTTTGASCGNNNGSITLGAVTGGVAPHTYSVNGSAFTATTLYNNLAAGTYTIAVTDANGCVFNAPSAVINNGAGPSAIAVTATDARCDNNNGSITLGAVTGGVAPYTYSVNGSAFTGTTLYNNLAAGTYTIAVTDANGCLFNAPDALINNPSGATAIAVTTADAGCGLSNGTITLGAVTGGVAPYTYSVNGSAFTPTTVYNNLAAGTYTIAVGDASGCVFNAQSALINSTGGATAIAVTTTDAGCGLSNGTLTLGTVTGGIAPHTYSVNGSAFTATTVYNNLSAGTYTIAVADANGCVFNAQSALINNTGGATAIAVTTTDANCGNSIGSITFGTVTGGVAPYTYSVNGSAFTATTFYSSLAAGTYTIAVTDANGCVFKAPSAVINNSGGATAISYYTTDATCGNANGSVNITPTGGAGPYTITPAQTGLAAGSYTFTVTDASGCSITVPVTITSTSGITATTSVISATCGNADGSVVITATGGTGPYTITPAQTGLAAGNYTFTVTDAIGCSTTIPVTVTQTGTPVLLITNPDDVCTGTTVDLTNSSITTGSAAGLTFTYWTDAAASLTLTNPAVVATSGTYYIKGTAVAGCFTIKPVTVTITSAIEGIRYPDVNAIAFVPKKLSARALGSNYSYNWTPATGLDLPNNPDPTFRYGDSVQYNINITSETGCVTTDTLWVKIKLAAEIYVPTAWTPNNDGVNDKLYPITTHIIKLNYFRIFDRWGQLMFETNVPGEGWDGIFHGAPQPMDVYKWIAEAVAEDGSIIKRGGNSLLLR